MLWMCLMTKGESLPFISSFTGLNGLVSMREPSLQERRDALARHALCMAKRPWREGVIPRENAIGLPLPRNSPRSGDRPRHSASSRCRRPCRSEEHTSELQSLMRISYAVFCLNKKSLYNHTQY